MLCTCGRGLEIPAGRRNTFTGTGNETSYQTVIAAELTESLVARACRGLGRRSTVACLADPASCPSKATTDFVTWRQMVLAARERID